MLKFAVPMTNPDIHSVIECQLAALGVASTLTDTARRVMERSAEQAGFYEAGRDRRVLPGFVPTEATPADVSNDSNGGGLAVAAEEAAERMTCNLILCCLRSLKKIPDPEKGWPAAQRVRWFKTFTMNVSQIYDGDDEPV
ncbi:hypothetical protein [Bradyrhizobium pachyrhizi]|uniref:hypothetical protein n=2 Tax=Bradyrhizobium TaxID=374 RepID=UPI00128E9F9D|nr:hypothetical protein [Bradyrhizobium pachyrhizi]